MPATERTVFVRAAAAALATGIAFDAASYLLAPPLRPPWLLEEYSAEIFRELIGPRVMSFAVGITAAAIAGLLAVAFVDAPRRFRRLAVAFTTLCVGSGALMLVVYFTAPPGPALASVAGLVPRGLAIAWAVDRVLPRPPAIG